MTDDDRIHVLAVAPSTSTLPLGQHDRFVVTAASSVHDAMQIVDRQEIEFVLVEHEQSVLDGVALLEAIRSRAPDVPVVLFAQGEAARRATAAGATETLADAESIEHRTLSALIDTTVESFRERPARVATTARATSHLDAARDGIAIVREGRYVFANTRLVAFYGARRREHVVGEPFPGELSFEGIRLDEDRLTAITRDEETLEAAEATLDAPVGSMAVEISAHPTEWIDRPAVVLIVRDVTDVKRVEERLRNYEQAVESSTDLLAALDRDRQFLFANERYCSYHDIEQATIEGRQLSEVVSEEAYEQLDEYAERVLEGETVQYETTRDHPELGSRILDVRYYPLWGVDGNVRGYGSTIRDVTERSERISQLRKIDRILRHNARNTLNVITGHAEMIQADGDAMARSHASKILETSDRLLDTFEKERRIAQLLADAPTRERLDLADVANEAVTAARERFPDARLSLSAPASAPVDASYSLPEAVMELVENAVVHATDSRPEVAIDITTGDDTALSVRDNNPSIPDVEMTAVVDDEAIDPLNHGRGLGLWYVALIVRRSGGRLEFDDNEPAGNVVRIVFEE